MSVARTITRRTFWRVLTGGLVLSAAGTGLIAAFAPTVGAGPQIISVGDALRLATSGEVLLIDIRTRGEWRKSGVAEPAIALTMHQSRTSFVRQLDVATGSDRSRAIALICATGGRTAYMQRELAKQGFSRVVDVGAGMFGSQHGKGWLASGLPIRQPTRSEVERAGAGAKRG